MRGESEDSGEIAANAMTVEARRWKLMATIATLFAIGASGAAVADEAPDITQMPAGRYHLDKNHTHVGWAISHVGFSQTLGRFDAIDGFIELDSVNPAKSKMEMTIDASSVDTHIDDLDDELRSADFFDVAKYPEIKFVFNSFEETGPAAGIIKGEMSLHGVTKPMKFKATLNKILPKPSKKKFTRMGFSANGMIDRMDWGISSLDIVGHEVEIRVEAEFLLDVDAG